ALGLFRLEYPDGPCDLHHHWLGLGLYGADALDLPQHPGDAARARLPGRRVAIPLACDRGGARMLPHPSDSVALSLDDALAIVADGAGRARRSGRITIRILIRRLPVSLTPRAQRCLVRQNQVLTDAHLSRAVFDLVQ